MTLDPIPVYQFLTPEPAMQAPTGFTVVDEAIPRGLPHSINLNGSISLVLSAPTGLAATWQDVDPDALVSNAGAEREHRANAFGEPLTEVEHRAAIAGAERFPVRLLVREGDVLVASVPLAAGMQRISPDGVRPGVGVRIEVILLDWKIYAGSMRGPGDFGARISLAWRQIDAAPDSFSAPPLNPQIAVRMDFNQKEGKP